MTKINEKYPEVDSIKEDAKSLKENTVRLKDHVVRDAKENGNAKFEEFKDNISDRAEYLSAKGQQQVLDLERKVIQNPLQSVAIAFGVGLALSLILGGRR